MRDIAIGLGIYAATAAALLYALHTRRRTIRRRRELEDRALHHLAQHHPDGPDQAAIDRIWAAVTAANPHLPPRSALGRHDTD